MIGMDVLSFISENWHVLPPILRTVIIIGAYLSSVAAAYFLERKGKTAVSGMFLFLSGLLLLGGIALLYQVFHILQEAKPHGLLGAWLVIYAPTFLIVYNLSIYIIYEIIALIYMNILCIRVYFQTDWGGLHFNAETLFSLCQQSILLILLYGVAWLTRRRHRKDEDSGGGRLLKKFSWAGLPGESFSVIFSS
jgi:hypothetical protein